MSQEKRRSPRYFFFASAELTEENSQIRVPSRVSELSLHGCYLDMMNPFPVDTVVHLTIESGNALFQTRAKTIHSTPNIGAGESSAVGAALYADSRFWVPYPCGFGSCKGGSWVLFLLAPHAVLCLWVWLLCGF